MILKQYVMKKSYTSIFQKMQLVTLKKVPTGL